MKTGTRVTVQSGDGTRDRGLGRYVGEATVYVIRSSQGLRSLPDAEQPIPASELQDGEKVVTLHDNPKIQLDTGEVVYGCQVWWQPVDEDALVFQPEDPAAAGQAQASADLRMATEPDLRSYVAFFVRMQTAQTTRGDQTHPAYLRLLRAYSPEPGVIPPASWIGTYSVAYLRTMQEALRLLEDQSQRGAAR